MRVQGDIVAYVEKEVRSSGVLRHGDRVLAAVSGGQDSVAMALALAGLADELALCFEVGHVNHSLRGPESDEDEEYVRRLAEKLAVPIHVERLNLDPDEQPTEGGLEETARRERFSALRYMALDAGLKHIAVAHTATDRAETVLMNILRGSGLEGLAAMPRVSGDIIRPMLSLTRADTAAYCAAKGVVPRQDSSNLDQRLLRNRIRHSLMPLLESEYWPGAERALLRLAEIVEGELEWTQPLVQEIFERTAQWQGEALALDLTALQQMEAGLRRRVLRRAMADLRGNLKDLSLEQLRALEKLATGGQTGHRAELRGLWAERTAEKVVLRPTGTRRKTNYRASLPVPGTTLIREVGLQLSSRLVPTSKCDPRRRGALRAQLDAAIVGPQLIVRPPEPGDRMTPLGMKGTKKLHDLFVDKKIPRTEREEIPVVVTTDGEIVWVVGHRISERAKVTDSTEVVAEIEARPLK